MEFENSAFQDVYEIGFNEGLSGDFTPDDNPYRNESYEDPNLRFYWGEGFFAGYKEYTNSLHRKDEVQ